MKREKLKYIYELSIPTGYSDQYLDKKKHNIKITTFQSFPEGKQLKSLFYVMDTEAFLSLFAIGPL